MNLFQKQKTPSGNIALLAIFTAILASFSLIIAFLPYSSLVIGLILPLISAVAVYYTENKYLILYIISASAICVLLTLWNVGDTLFFVLPSIISGSLFGFFRQKKIPEQALIFISANIQIVLHYIAYLLLSSLTSFDIQEIVIKLLEVDRSIAGIIFFSFIYVLSLAEAGLNYLIIECFLDKIEQDQADYRYYNIISCLFTFGLGAETIFLGIIGFGPNKYMIPFLITTAFFSLTNAATIFKNRKVWLFILLGVMTLVSIFAMAIFYQFFRPGYGVAGFAFFFISLTIVSFISIFENKMAK